MPSATLSVVPSAARRVVVMLKVVRLVPGSKLGLLKKYVPFRLGCPNAPPTVTRVELVSLHAGTGALRQSQGVTTLGRDWIVTFAVVPVFTIETSWGIAGTGGDNTVPAVLQNDLGSANKWPKST